MPKTASSDSEALNFSGGSYTTFDLRSKLEAAKRVVAIVTRFFGVFSTASSLAL